MRVHHFNCGSMCPVGMQGTGGDTQLADRAKLVCHCLAIETSAGVVLVDTGLGLRDVEQPGRLPLPMRLLMRTRLDVKETLKYQLANLGFAPEDVRHIVLTHLDFDHAGGIEDFPHAAVHVAQAELDAVRARSSVKARLRYRPSQWEHVASWRPFEPVGERWRGFECVRDIPGLPREILIVPLPGHSPGHCGVAIQRPGGWLLHAADAYFHHDELHSPDANCPMGLRGYQSFMETDRAERLHNRERLRELLRNEPDVTVVCSHDVQELEGCMRKRARRAITTEISP